MKRMKKLYSLKETTIKFIKEWANDQCISESWALDQIVENFQRIIESKRKNKEQKEIEAPQWYKDMLK